MSSQGAITIQRKVG